ncbi:MAG: hypothetical protein VYA34_07890 [Myxococcota bacterium]|nr:hypothetical protein [Myxococcota bacterium]
MGNTTSAPIVDRTRKDRCYDEYFLRKVLSDPETHYYSELWNGYWEIFNQEMLPKAKTVKLLAKAVKNCQFDDPRETQYLIAQTLNHHQKKDFEASIEILRRRGGRQIFKTATDLLSNDTCAEKIFGIRLLSRLGTPFEPWVVMAQPHLEKIIAETNPLGHTETVISVIGYLNKDLSPEAATQIAKGRIRNSSSPKVRGILKGKIFSANDASSVKEIVQIAQKQESQIKREAQTALLYLRTLSRRRQVYNHSRPDSPRRPKRQTPPPKPISRVKPSYLQVVTGDDSPHQGIHQFEKKKNRTNPKIKHRFGIAAAMLAMTFLSTMALSQIDEPKPRRKSLLSTKSIHKTSLPMADDFFGHRSVGQVLNLRKTAWLLFHRTHLPSAASFFAAPKQDKDSINLTHIVKVLADAGNKGSMDRATLFVSLVGDQNPKLASEIAQKTINGLNYWHRDDFVRHLGGIEPGSTLRNILHEESLLFNPGLQKLNSSTKKTMANILLRGWSTSKEEALARHLVSPEIPFEFSMQP